VRDCILKNADPISTDKPIGSKRLNAFKALNACSNAPITPQPTTSNTQVPSPTAVTTQLQLTGEVFVDTNRNSRRDLNEAGVTNVQVVIDGPVDLTINPDSNGRFSLSNLSPGSYIASVNLNGVKVASTSQFTLSLQVPMYNILFAIPPFAITQTPTNSGQIGPTPIIVRPTSTAIKVPTPTPAKKYTCTQNTGARISRDAIQIGTLVCTPKT
jgi:hypothetical protein